MKPTLLILAAGMGSRYGGLKQLDPLGPGGEKIIDYSVNDAVEAGFGKVVFVIRKSFEKEFIEKVSSKFENSIEVIHVFQELDSLIKIPIDREKPWGTGHAVLVTKDVIQEPFAVINADDYYGKAGFKVMADFLKNEGSPAKFSMVGYQVKNTLSDFGSVSRGVCNINEKNYLTDVVERTSISRAGDGAIYFEEEGKKVHLHENTLVSMNFWGFHPNLFNYISEQFEKFVQDNKNNPRAEYFIPIFVNSLLQEKRVDLSVLTSSDKWFGVTYAEDKPLVMNSFKKLHDEGLYKTPLW